MNKVLLNGKVVNKNTNEWNLNCSCVYNGKNTSYLTRKNTSYLTIENVKKLLNGLS